MKFPVSLVSVMTSATVDQLDEVAPNRGSLLLGKVLFSMVVAAVLFSMVMTAIVSLGLLWATRTDELPGIYRASGVWGSSTLTLRADHTFTQDVQSMAYDEPSVWPYRQHPTKHEVIDGRWEERGRDPDFPFDRKLLIKPLINLGPWNQGVVSSGFEGAYGPVMLSGLGIEVDTGADIVYRK